MTKVVKYVAGAVVGVYVGDWILTTATVQKIAFFRDNPKLGRVAASAAAAYAANKFLGV